MEINKSEIAALDKKKRLHLINSITGITTNAYMTAE